MIAQHFRRRGVEFKQWWQAPVRGRDRLLGCIVGAMAGLWIGLFAGFYFIQGPAPLTVFLQWILAGMAACAVAGLIFPKYVSVLLFPFTTLGGSFTG